MIRLTVIREPTVYIHMLYAIYVFASLHSSSDFTLIHNFHVYLYSLTRALWLWIQCFNPFFFPRPLRANLIADHRPTMSMYLQALESNTTLEAIMGPSWRSFVTRPKLVVWMSSHCPTSSRREDYVTELQKYIHVEVFGFCGKFQCGEHFDAFGSTCWERRLRPQYLFYLTMENSLCDEYITEKLYNPLIHGLVPVVYGCELSECIFYIIFNTASVIVIFLWIWSWCRRILACHIFPLIWLITFKSKGTR